MQIRKSTSADLEQILVLYAKARQFMQENGNPTQWGSKYPPQEQVERDIKTGRSYVCEEDGELLCVFYFAVVEDPDYQNIYEGSWLTDGPYGVMHRVAARGKRRGVASFCVAWCFEASGGDLRIDTHHDNIPMQRMLEKNGFVRCGTIYTANHSPRIAYEKIREAAARE